MMTFFYIHPIHSQIIGDILSELMTSFFIILTNKSHCCYVPKIFIYTLTLVDVSSAASDTRHVNKGHRHNLNTHMHAGTTSIRLATSKTRHTVLPEDGPIGLKHVGENDDIL